MIRVLVAEDSATMRELLVAVLTSDPELVVAGEAKNGLEAVEMAKRLRPDVIVMDVRMPVMDGLEATKRIMVEVPTPIVIVSGSFDMREIEVSMHALRVGALTVLPKPPGPESPEFAEAGRHFASTVKAMAQVKVVRRWPERPGAPGPVAARVARAERARVVAITASTGGPAALSRLLSGCPVTCPCRSSSSSTWLPGSWGGSRRGSTRSHRSGSRWRRMANRSVPVACTWLPTDVTWEWGGRRPSGFRPRLQSKDSVRRGHTSSGPWPRASVRRSSP